MYFETTKRCINMWEGHILVNGSCIMFKCLLPLEVLLRLAWPCPLPCLYGGEGRGSAMGLRFAYMRPPGFCCTRGEHQSSSQMCPGQGCEQL